MNWVFSYPECVYVCGLRDNEGVCITLKLHVLATECLIYLWIQTVLVHGYFNVWHLLRKTVCLIFVIHRAHYVCSNAIISPKSKHAYLVLWIVVYNNIYIFTIHRFWHESKYSMMRRFPPFNEHFSFNYSKLPEKPFSKIYQPVLL